MFIEAYTEVCRMLKAKPNETILKYAEYEMPTHFLKLEDCEIT
jgi:hypothetical protein